LAIAPVGQTATHQGFSQWKHGRKADIICTLSGRRSGPTVINTPGLTLAAVRFFTWQCTSQALQLMHRCGSCRIMYLLIKFS
jgi:hypothetical protein